MLLSSNGRTPVFQTDVDAGSIPVKSTKRPCRLRWLGHHPLKVKKADRHRSGLQKIFGNIKILSYICKIKTVRSSSWFRTSPFHGEDHGFESRTDYKNIGRWQSG